MEIVTPRNDGGVGVFLKGVPPAESTLHIKGEVKAIRKIKLASGNDALLFAINNDSLKLIECLNK